MDPWDRNTLSRECGGSRVAVKLAVEKMRKTRSYSDFDRDGMVDLLSGSNCCAAFSFHWLRGISGRSFGEMQTIGFQRSETVAPVRSFPLTLLAYQRYTPSHGLG